jgi:DNA-binding response OmpR family regulator
MTSLLVIDEEENTRLLYEDEFKKEGYQVTAAETTREALETIQQNKPDIITLDLKIPGTEGIEFLRRVKKESGIPVILCSAYAGYRQGVRIGVAVCDAFVVKSADFTELKAIIRHILSYKQFEKSDFFRAKKTARQYL